MHPEWSIIILTVLAGVAEGVFIFLVGADVMAPLTGAEIPVPAVMAGCAAALALAGIGTAASFLHLHHKARGVKAINQWKSSWLSREAFLLPVFMGAVFVYGALTMIHGPEPLRMAVGFAGVAIGVLLGLASGMIYATVRFIREWGNGYTPVNFILLGLATGGVVLTGLFEVMNVDPRLTLAVLRGAVAVTLFAFVMKLMAYRHNDTFYTPTTLRTATGFGQEEIEQTDTGCSYEHYNTKEYHYKAGKAKSGGVRYVTVGALFLLPLATMVVDYMPLFRGGAVGGAAALGAVVMIGGGFAERWLFFVEGNHIQNLYYGAFPSKRAPNPITTPAKAVHPRPVAR
jgi:DMSO reductase anchor subunit